MRRSFVRFGLAYLNVNLQVNYDGTEGFGTYKICVDLSGIRVMQSLASFPSGEQHHVCLSCQQISGSNVTVRLFVDGVIQATMSSTDTNWALAPSVVAEIGRTSFSGFAGIRGSVDEWRMRTGYLTADFTPESYPYCSSASAPSNPPPATAETVNTSFANLVVGSTISMAADSTAAVSGPVPLRQIAIAAGSTQVVGTPRPGAPFSVNESAAAVTVWVYGQLPFTVDWETYDITAIAGVHYTAASGTIAAVAAVNQFNVALLGGANTTFGDPARKFGVRLLNPSTGCELMPGAEQVEITILDDELAPGISFAAAPLGPGGEIQFDATLSNVGAVDLSFNYRISYAGVPASWLVGTASYSVDLTNYTLIGLATFGGTVVFPAGVTTIRIRQDLTLSGASPRPLCRMTLQGSTGQYSSPTF